MTKPESHTLSRINEILERANGVAMDLQQTSDEVSARTPDEQIMATVGALGVLVQTQSALIGALIKAVGVLAVDIDELRQEMASGA